MCRPLPLRHAECTCYFVLRYRVRTDDELGHAYTKIVVEHQHFAACNQPSVDENIHRVAGQLVERHDRSLTKLQHVFQIHVGPAQLNLQIEFNVADQVEGSRFSGMKGRFEFFQLVRRYAAWRLIM